jgi:hypothetical protein
LGSFSYFAVLILYTWIATMVTVWRCNVKFVEQSCTQSDRTAHAPRRPRRSLCFIFVGRQAALRVSAPCSSGLRRRMGAGFLCICPPKTIHFDQSKDNSKAEISSRLSAVGAFQSQDASEIYCPGAGLIFTPSHDLSVTTQEACFAVFKG